MSNKREMKTIKNLNFLRKVQELKVELFEAYSPTITKETKKKAWTTVRDYAVSIGLITNDKDYTYVRDTTWTNLRKRTMEKVDKSSKTGGSGGPESKIDSVDEMVILIVGKESPALKGLGVEDSMYVRNADIKLPVQSSLYEEESFLDEVGLSCTMPDETLKDATAPLSAPLFATTSKKRKHEIVKTMDNKKQFEILKKEKLELEVLKLKLEVWETENRLKVQHSELTKNITPLPEYVDCI